MTNITTMQEMSLVITFASHANVVMALCPRSPHFLSRRAVHVKRLNFVSTSFLCTVGGLQDPRIYIHSKINSPR